MNYGHINDYTCFIPLLERCHNLPSPDKNQTLHKSQIRYKVHNLIVPPTLINRIGKLNLSRYLLSPEEVYTSPISIFDSCLKHILRQMEADETSWREAQFWNNLINIYLRERTRHEGNPPPLSQWRLSEAPEPIRAKPLMEPYHNGWRSVGPVGNWYTEPRK